MQHLIQVLSIALLVLGFGFVIFWHELGHFLAAKWVGIKVEQFAVGFGQALFSWRKGLGWRLGSSAKEYEAKLKEAADAERPAPELGETEYRLNWIPLGGYVKMLGQDDLNPNNVVEDPRAYNRKSIGARMIVVSAGVVMNVILAGILFMGLFMYGFNAPPAVVGGVQPWSPAEKAYRLVNGQRQPAAIEVGDKILTFDGQPQYDWTKIQLSAALSKEAEAVPLEVQRHETGAVETVYIMPVREDPSAGMGLALGVAPARTLEGIDSELIEPKLEELYPADFFAVKPGERVTAINGRAVKDPKTDYPMLSEALQAKPGESVTLTVAGADGKERQERVSPRFAEVFGQTPLNFAGMVPRTVIEQVLKDSPVRGKILPGDVILKMVTAGDPLVNPTREAFVKRVGGAGADGKAVELTVLRDGKETTLEKIIPSVPLKGPRRGQRGLGVAPWIDAQHAVVAEVREESPAAQAGIPAQSTLTAVGGQPVTTWFDVYRELSKATAGQPVQIAFHTAAGENLTRPLTLTADQLESVRGLRLIAPLFSLKERIEKRKASNPLQAAAWGAAETRDFILQFYITIRRMVEGTVSPTALMGPYGIFKHGAFFAFKGMDWLVWFLAMISANLAVVNFLPIPIVDGGLFVFLILEKIKGRPLSPRVQSIAQVIGLALLLGIFLFVTYHDIMREF